MFVLSFYEITKKNLRFSLGCHANPFYADAPKPQIEVLTDAFWDYVAKATQTADDTLQMIRKSQLGQDVRYVTKKRHFYFKGIKLQDFKPSNSSLSPKLPLV